VINQHLRFNGCGLVTSKCLAEGWSTCQDNTTVAGVSHLSVISNSEGMELVLSIQTQCYLLLGYNISEALKSSDPQCALFLPKQSQNNGVNTTSKSRLRLLNACLHIDAEDVIIAGSSLRASLEAATCLPCNVDHYSTPGDVECTPCPTDTRSTGKASSCQACRICPQGSYRTVSLLKKTFQPTAFPPQSDPIGVYLR